jgi:hypothetical protein
MIWKWKARKIRVEIPIALLKKAHFASGTGIAQTVRTGLQCVATSRFARLTQFRGKLQFKGTLSELRADR